MFDFLRRIFRKSIAPAAVLCVAPEVSAAFIAEAVKHPSVGVAGEFRGRIVNADGSVAEDFLIANAATNEGLNSLLNTGFRGTTQVTTYYLAPINGSGFTAVSVNDTAASHAGWTELTNYSESVRQQWSPGAAAAGVLTNTSPISFTINTTSVSIQGIAVFSVSTKSSTSGILWATAVDVTPRTLTNGQTFQVYYTVTLTPIS